MEIDKQIAGLESELKLLKGELKETLMSVRDLLGDIDVPRFDSRTGPAIDMKVQMSRESEQEISPIAAGPLTQEAEPLLQEPVSADAGQGETFGSPETGMEVPPLQQMPEEQPATLQDVLVEDAVPLQEVLVEDAVPLQEVLVEDAVPLQDVPLAEAAPLEEMPLDEPSAFQEVDIMPPNTASELPGQLSESGRLEEATDEASCERSTEEKMRGEEEGPTTSQVNLLANLVRWVSCAKKEIGDELLPVFLEVYGIGGHLPDELRQCILHLVPVVAQQTDQLEAASVWSRLTLELSGILTGGGALPHPLSLSWSGDKEDKTQQDGTEAEGEELVDRPIRLKLAVPVGDGVEKEYSIVLAPEGDGARSQDAPPSPGGHKKRSRVR